MIFTVLFIAIFLILSIPVQIILRLLMFIPPLKVPVKKISLRIVAEAFNIVRIIGGVKLDIRGEENIPAGEAVLYVANHRSYYDIVILYSRMRELPGFIAKKEILAVPVLNIWMWFLDCIFLDRKDIRKGMEMIEKAASNVSAGISYVIFPEGTRNKTEDKLLPFHKGSFKIAQRSGCAIIPVSLSNTRQIYEAHPFRVRRTNVIVEYGKPVYFKDLTREEQRHIDDIVENRILEMYDGASA